MENTTTLREYGRALLETVGFLLIMGGLFALICYATPNQLSAEADLTAQCLSSCGMEE